MRLCAFVISLVLLGSSSAAAPPDAREQARRKYQDGLAQFRLNHFLDAARLYTEAYQLAPDRVAFLFNIALAYQRDWEGHARLDSLAKAVQFYEQYAASVPQRAEDAEVALRELRPLLGEERKKARRARIDAARGDEAVALAEVLIGEQAFTEAATLLARTERQPRQPRRTVAALHRARARLGAARGDLVGATESYKRVLALEPGYALSGQADAANEQALAEARTAIGRRTPLQVSHVPGGEVLAGGDATLEVHVSADGLGLLRRVLVAYRRLGSRSYAEVTYPVGTRELRLPRAFTASLGPGSGIEYYVQMLGEHDAILVEFGSAAEPFRLGVRDSGRPAAVAPQPWFKRWWVWTIAGVLVAGAGGTAYLATRGDPAGPPDIPIRVGP